MSDAHIRWMIRRDMPEVLAIENAAFEFPWSEDDFTKCLRQRNCIGMVAEQDGGDVAGYMIYELMKQRLHLIAFAVHPDMRRQGVGRKMIDKMVSKLSGTRRSSITLEIRETNLAGQLFFRAMGFKAVKVVRGHYDDTDEDAYRMVFRSNRQEPSHSTPQR